MTDRDKFEGLIAFLRKAKDNNDVNDERYCCVIDGLIDDFIASMQEEPVSEELEQAAEHFAFHHTYSGDMEYIAENEKEVFKAGANWQKEQMMKEAEDVWFDEETNMYSDEQPLRNFNAKKAKLIIVKEG